jgi:hypothetical protein
MPRPKPQSRTRRPELKPIIRAYFLDETSFEKLKAEDEARYGDIWHYNQDAWTLMELEYTYNEDKLKALWRAYEAEIVTEYADKHPGERPSMWWRYTAPKMSETDLEAHGWSNAFFAAELCEPRRRLGGIGDPTYEHSAAVPSFNYGMPECWADDAFASRFGGAAVDPAKPPTFESEASYLRRLGLFLPGEEERCDPDFFNPVRLPKCLWQHEGD